jgi:hypothetical protein
LAGREADGRTAIAHKSWIDYMGHPSKGLTGAVRTMYRELDTHVLMILRFWRYTSLARHWVLSVKPLFVID